MDHFSAAIASISRASKQKQPTTIVANTKLIRKSLQLLIRGGYLSGFSILNKEKLEVSIKFDENNNPVIRNISRTSKTGSRVYVSYKKLESMNRNISLVDTYKSLIISTPQGLVTSFEACSLRHGGEVLFSVN